MLLTATYQVSPEGFARTQTPEFPDGIPHSAIPRFLETAINVAEQAASSHGKIALSLGPYGACMIPGQEYSGEYDAEHDSEDALHQWHLSRLRLFRDAAGGDLLSRVQYVAFETLPRLDEVRAVRRAARDAGITAPVWISCVFPREDECLPDGSTVEEVVDAAVAPMRGGLVPWGIGVNCTKVQKLPGLVEKFGACIRKAIAAGRISTAPALVLYPDGTNGEVYNTTTQAWEKRETTDSQEQTNTVRCLPCTT